MSWFKPKILSFGIGLFSMLLCLWTQPTLANGKADIKIEADLLFQSSISGTVVDADGIPLAGVNVLVKGTTNGTQTDFDGNYTLKKFLTHI